MAQMALSNELEEVEQSSERKACLPLSTASQENQACVRGILIKLQRFAQYLWVVWTGEGSETCRQFSHQGIYSIDGDMKPTLMLYHSEAKEEI
jgi:hypothetical protein